MKPNVSAAILALKSMPHPNPFLLYFLCSANHFMRTLLAWVALEQRVKANLGCDRFRPPLGLVNVWAMQQDLETEGLAVVFVCMQLLGNTQCNGSGCGGCLLNGKG